MKVRYPGRATAIGPAAMEFHYEANWQEVTQKWGLQDREKKAAQTVNNISKIGVKLPGLTKIDDSWETSNDDESKMVLFNEDSSKKRVSTNGSTNSSLERQINNASNQSKLPLVLNGLDLRRNGSDAKINPNTPYSELEKRYQIITSKDVGSVPENLKNIVLKQAEMNKETSPLTNGNVKGKSDSFRQTTQAVKSDKDNERRFHDDPELVRSEVVQPGSSQARTMPRQVNGRDLQEANKTTKTYTQGPLPLPRTKPLHQRNPNDVISPPPPKMKPVNSTAVKFKNEPTAIIPKRMDAFLDKSIPMSQTSYNYADFTSDADDIPKPKETLELQPIPPALRPVRVQPREDEIVSSWAARKRRELQQEKNRRKAHHSHHHSYEEIDSWEVEEDDSLYNGNVSKRGKGSHKSADEFSSSSGGRQKSNSSDLLRETFRIDPKERTSSLDSGHFDGQKPSPVPFSKFNNFSDSLEVTDFSRMYPRRTSPDDSAFEPDSLNPVESQESEFIIPRPKLIVPVHTYGIRKRRTGNMLHSSRRGSEVETVLSGSGGNSDKKHHTSCPGMRVYLVSIT